jgi:hypothetical protein
MGNELIVAVAGRCQGALVRHQAANEDGSVTVEFLVDSGPYKVGSVARFLKEDVRWVLDPGDRVAYDPQYLARNNADGREYKRRARVVARRERGLVALEWDDGMGPQTDSTLHLVRL